MVSEGSRGSQEGCFGDKSGVSSELGSEVCSHGGDFMELGGTPLNWAMDLCRVHIPHHHSPE